MRQLISGLVAAAAVVTVSAAPALACGGGLFTSCSPCGQQAYVSPCGQAVQGYGYGYGYGVAAYERLPEPSPQYFYANQGPTYGGPGMFAPVPTYQESAVSGWGSYQTREAYYGGGGHYGTPALEAPADYGYQQQHYYRPHRSYYGGYTPRMNYRYGYAPHRYAQHYAMPQQQYYAPHHSLRYGYHAEPRYYGHQRLLRRYY
jgi:hypothetical protein